MIEFNINALVMKTIANELSWRPVNLQKNNKVIHKNFEVESTEKAYCHDLHLFIQLFL